MASVAVSVLIGILFVGMLAGVIVVIIVIITTRPTQDVIQQSCESTTANLVDITSLECVKDSVTNVCTNQKLYTQNSFSYDTLMVPYPVPYTEACASICQGTISSTGCNDPNTSKQYDSCLAQLAPSNCNGTAMPQAFSTNVYYYVSRFLTEDQIGDYTDTCVC